VVLIELYTSVQGESSFAGLPCIFVRLAGCNLRCSWCDSEYTFSGGEKHSLDEVEQKISALAPVKLVEFTGGEPMLQERELLPIMDRLLARDYTLLLETSGERPLASVPKAVHKIMDVKCPASGESGRFYLPNLEALTMGDEVKFVLSDREDYEFARLFIRQHDLAARCAHILLSPAFTKTPTPERSSENCTLDPRTLVEWMLADQLPARLSLQIHKFIWEPLKKGV
jgi:7-carboxy-7-deazaguanine synthase